MSDTEESVETAMLLGLRHALIGDGNLDELHRASARSRKTPENNRLCDYIMVAVIDFGTTFSGYAFGFRDRRNFIRMNKNWGVEIGCVSYKTPTCVLVDPKKKFNAFGYDAQQKYADMIGAEDQQYYFFDRFKMKLYNEKELNKSVMLEAANGKTLPALDIFAMALEYMKNHLLHTVKQSLISFDETMVRWVITVPAIWSNSSKQFMREAALKSGMIDKLDSGQLLIALEPEVASLYVRKLEIDRFKDESHAPSDSLAIKPGTKYLVIDAGGGTLDVTTHELLPNGSVKELYFATGGAYGGIKVDEEFVKVLVDIFGAEFINEYKKSNASQWLQLMLDFEKRKRSASGVVCLPIPYTFIDRLKEKKKVEIEKVVKAYPVKGIKFASGVLRFDADEVANLFLPVTDGIVHHIQTLLANPKLKGVEYFFCVGGFNESKHLQNMLQETFSHVYKFIIPEEASLAVLKGAVQFGHQPDVINSRISARTYGVSAVTDFIPFVHDPKQMVRIDGRLLCIDIFKTFVMKGEEIPQGFLKTYKFKPITDQTKEADVQVYSSDCERVKYTTERGVKHHGNITVKWRNPGKDRTIMITMAFGGTEMEVEAVTFPGENKADTKINFLVE